MAGTFYIATFGCRTNQADSATIREQFLAERYQEAPHWNQADVIVVNSCTVTHRSDQQVGQLTRRFHRDNPSAKIVVTGCFAQRVPQRVSRIEGVDLVVGNSHKENLIPLITEATRSGFVSPEEVGSIYWGEFAPAPEQNAHVTSGRGQRTRPLVKIQDGCDAKCSYCIIPQVRGPSRSVPPQLVIQKVAELVEQGSQEIVLTGIHIGTYGMHWHPRYPLDRLLGDLIRLPGLGRLRLSSIEPMQLSRRVTALAANSEKIAPHFHICLQSGSDRVLKRMLRPYTTARFAAILEEIHRILPQAAIGTDLITGFPEESEEDHRQTLAFVREMPFSYLHVFPYSDRPGTAATRMSSKVRSQTIKRRSLELRQLSEEKNRRFRRQFIGQALSALTLSAEQDGMRVALSSNYLRAKLQPSPPENRLVDATVVGEDAEGYLLLNGPPEPGGLSSRKPPAPPPLPHAQTSG